MNMCGKTIAITGATGFIGGRLAERCVKSGAYIRALVRPTSKITHLQSLNNVETIIGDLNDQEALLKLVDSADIVYHCAATLQFWGDLKFSHQINVVGTQNVLQACEKTAVGRLVHVSTVGVHGPEKAHSGSTENAPFTRYKNTYLTTKIAAEKIILGAIKEKRLSCTIVRPGHVYGAKDSSTVLSMIIHALRWRYFAFIGEGKVGITLTYIDNLIDGMIRAGVNPNAKGEAFILTDGSNVTFYDFVAEICRHTHLPMPKIYIPLSLAYVGAIGGDMILQPFFWFKMPPPLRLLVAIFSSPLDFDISKAKKLLGYSPVITFEDGMKRTFEWMIAKKRV